VSKPKFRFLRIIAWIVAGIISLILLATLVFYLGRDYFVNRGLSYLNEQQPGEVQMAEVYLIPFINFPHITLHLQDVKFYERGLVDDSTAHEPIIALNDIAVTLDLIKLIKGGVRISEARLKDGFVHLEIYPDSLTNLENALGIRFGEPAEQDTSQTMPSIAIDLDKLELVNIRGRMDNYLNEEYVDIQLNKLESSFSYHPGLIQSTLEVDIYINSIKYQALNNQIDKIINLKGSISLDQDTRILKVEPCNLNVSGLAFETWGLLDLGATPRIDLAYTATNEGLELLNFLFLGILDLDEIEQIGNGSIHLNGSVQGDLEGARLPVIRVIGEAEDLGFRIKTVDRDVTGITFSLFATNGGENDLSEGFVEVQDFTAKFPEGNIYANITASNIKSPELNVEVDCDLNLEGMGEMIKMDQLSNLSGSVGIRGQINGSVNQESGNFINDEGSLTASLEDVSFVFKRDSTRSDSIQHISGELVLHDTIFEAENLTLEYNGNPFQLGVSTENLLLYLLDYDRDLGGVLSISSEGFNTATLLGDTSISSIIGEEIRDFYICAGAKIEKADLDRFIEHDSIPELLISLDSFGISMPLMADVSKVKALLNFGPDSISLQHFYGTIGESSFDLSGLISNYDALSRGDSGEIVALDFRMSSDLLRAEDLFTINKEFLLPENFRSEFLKDFRISGKMEAPAAGLVFDSISTDFGIDIYDLGWSFRYYPDMFKDFLIQIKREGDLLVVDNIQGSVGENNFMLSASIENFNDTLVENMSGSFELYSDLLDINQLLNYQQPKDQLEVAVPDSSELRETPRLHEVDYPQIDFTVNIGELRYGKNRIYGMNGNFRTSKEKIFYLDRLVTSPEGKGTLEFNGQLNVANPEQYFIMADLNLKGIDIGDLNLELQSGDSTYMLNENFQGIVDARGLAEIFLTPELEVDIPTSTAQFNLWIHDGALINFTPLQAAGKFLDTKNLNNVRFATVRNSFTLIDSKIIIPLMNVESTVGQLLIEGEQGLDNSYLYLVRVPPRLAREAARSAMAERERDDGEDQISQMKRGDFLNITVWSNGTESDFKLGDRRDKFQE